MVSSGLVPNSASSSLMTAALSCASRRDQVRDFTSTKYPSLAGFVSRSR